MTLYDEIEDALLSYFREQSSLAGVKTWESSIREALAIPESQTNAFRAEEMPAVNLATQSADTKSEMMTAAEVKYSVATQLVVVVRATKKDAAQRQAAELELALTAAIHAARRSDVIGANTWVMGEVGANTFVIEGKPYCFAIAKIDFQVVKVVDL